MTIPVYVGTQFEINGSGFLAGSLVYIDDVTLADDILVVTSNRILCRAPAHVVGFAAVKVVNPDTQEYEMEEALDYQVEGAVHAALRPLAATGAGSILYASAATPAVSSLAGSGSGSMSFAGSGSAALSPGAADGVAVFTNPGIDPNTFALRFYVKPNYGGTPWAGASSAGTSGTAGYGVKAGSAPANGTAVNSLTPADFNGTSHYLTTSGTSQTSPLLATGPGSKWVGTMFFVFKTRTTNAPTGFGLTDTAFFTGTSGGYAMGVFSTDGFGGGFGFAAPGMVACSTGAWHFGCVRVDGTSMDVNVDAATKSTFTKSGATVDGAFHMGTTFNASGKFYDGLVLYAGGMGTVMSDADVAGIGLWFQNATGQSFGF